MKVSKIILITVLVFLLVGGIGTFFHFKNKFMSAPPNILKLSETGVPFKFIWEEINLNGRLEPHGAILVPVRIPNIDQVFHMQFDTGAPSTVLYYNTVKSINEKYDDILEIAKVDEKWLVNDVNLTVGSVNLQASYLQFKGMGAKVDWSNPPRVILLGTVGSDFMEKHVLTMDFTNQQIALSDTFLNGSITEDKFSPFTFEGRKVFLSAKLNGETASLWFDTGSSPYELIVEESTFEQLSVPDAPRETYTINSWGTKVFAHNKKAEGEFIFGTTSVPLSYVTYMEWPNQLQALILKLSNIGGDLGGMTGNKLFINKTLVLDTPNLRYAVLPPNN